MPRTLTIDTKYSPNDDAWYADIWDAQGRDVYTTGLHDSRKEATRMAKNYVWRQEDGARWKLRGTI